MRILDATFYQASLPLLPPSLGFDIPMAAMSQRSCEKERRVDKQQLPSV